MSTILLLSVIALPFLGFIITNIINYVLPLRRGLIASTPTAILFINVIISLYLFYTIAFLEYNKILASQLAPGADVYYNAKNVSLDLGT